MFLSIITHKKFMLISNLSTQQPALGNEVFVYGYATAGDGGGGYFAWKTTAELPAGATVNTGIWFTGPVSTGLWERQFSSEGPVNIRWFGAKGDASANDTAAIQNTINFASSFGYSVFIPKGTYLIDTVLLKSNVFIFGEGDLSVLQLLNDPASHIFLVDTQSGSTSNNIQNVRISDLKFYSSFLFSQFKHFICLNGVSNFIIEKCLFMQFRGDAIYLGAGVGTNTHVTHNENITIRDCRFDGVGKTNRNAISIIDGSNIQIENNYFVNCTNSSMPGAIDIEPDSPPSGTCTEILKDIIIANNFFSNVGGNSTFMVQLPPFPFSTPPSGIHFQNNYIEDCVRGIFFGYKYVPTAGVEVKDKIPFFVKDNVLKNISLNGFELIGSCMALISENYINALNTNVIGYDQPSDFAIDIILSNNYFDNCGSASGYGLMVFNCKRIKFNFNTFDDCGPVTGGGTAILFNGGTVTVPCSSDYIAFEQNIFLTPKARTSIAIQKAAYDNFTNPRNNRFINNQLNGLPSVFQYINDNNFGLANGLSSAISVTIAHGLGSIPKWVTVQPQSNNVSGIKNITVDATNVTVTFTALPSGTVNLWWSAQA